MAFAKRRYLNNRRFDGALKLLNTTFLIKARRISILALFFCMAGLSATPASASEAGGADGDDSEPVVFAIPDVWPWAYEDQDRQPQGSLVTVARRLSELSGVPVEPRLRPLRRALIELDKGEVDFSLLFESPELDRRAINVARVMRINIMLAAPADTDYPLTLEALEGQRIGYIRGTYLGEAFERNTDVQKVPVAVISQAIEMLPLSRLSAILASDHAIMQTLQAMGLRSDVLRYSKHIEGQPGVLYMSRRAQRPAEAEKFRKAVRQMMESGEMNRIFFGDAGRPTPDSSQ